MYLNHTRFSSFKRISGQDRLCSNSLGFMDSPVLLTFLVDQFLHVASIMFLYQVLFLDALSRNLLFTLFMQKTINCLFLVLLIGKPSNVFITIASARYMPDKNNKVGIQGRGPS